MTEYLLPTSVEQAIDLLERYRGEARVIAGGTDVMPAIRKQEIRPRCLVDITRIPGLDQVETDSGFLTLGAAVTFAAIKDSVFLNRRVHALVEAARCVGTLAIQAVATWAGNIVQAMPAADGAVVAVALEAEARVADSRGVEWQPVESLFAGPGVSAVDPSRQLITHIRFPICRPSSARALGTAWGRVGRRPSLVLPILNCAVKLCLSSEDGRIERACIALGPVAPRPFRARQAEAFLKGQLPTEEVFAQAAHIAQEESNPRSSRMRASREYRLAIILPLVSDGLAVAAERARP
jgi:CO/xanthine dehydrogenase FAD-binding subunit